MRRHDEGVDRRTLVAVDRRRVHPQRVQRQYARRPCDSSPRRSGAIIVDVEDVRAVAGVISTCTPRVGGQRKFQCLGRRDRRAAAPRRPSPVGTGGPGHRSATPSSRPTPRARWPASPPRRAHAATPAAPGRRRGRRRPPAMVAGSCRSLAGRGVRQQQVVAHDLRQQSRRPTATDPSRVPIWVARSAPMTLWSPPRPLPMSWHSAPSTSRSGRATRVVNALARETVSTRWRSTVQMWTTSRGGRSRTAPHSGNSLPHKPVRSSASIVDTAAGPAASITSRSLSACRGHGVRSSGAVAASRPSVGRRHRQAGGRRCRRHPQDQPGITLGAGVAGQDDLAAELEYPLVERRAHGPA